MCEICDTKGLGWRGWLDLPPPPVSRPRSAGWSDLSHPLHPGMPRLPSFPEPSFRRLRSIPDAAANVTEMQMAVHTGTHVDAPRHFFNDGPAFDAIPFDRLHGPGVVLHLEAEPHGLIDAGDLARATPEVRPGDIVALDTGWAAKAGTDAYAAHPSLTAEAARWLVERRVKLLACDFATPDMAQARRPPGFDFPVHNTLLSQGVLICEHLTNHAHLAGGRVEFVVAALNIRESDGAPARVLARAVED